MIQKRKHEVQKELPLNKNLTAAAWQWSAGMINTTISI